MSWIPADIPNGMLRFLLNENHCQAPTDDFRCSDDDFRSNHRLYFENHVNNVMLPSSFAR